MTTQRERDGWPMAEMTNDPAENYSRAAKGGETFKASLGRAATAIMCMRRQFEQLNTALSAQVLKTSPGWGVHSSCHFIAARIFSEARTADSEVL